MENYNTEQDFIIAFWKLYEINPIEKISIIQLCKCAGYNRSTFYNHFENIYDLLDSAVSDILSPIKANISSLQDYNTLIQKNLMSTIIFDCFRQKNKYIELLFKRQNYHLLGEKIKKFFMSNILKDIRNKKIDFNEVEILLEYQMSAVLGVINYWYKKGRKIPEENILQKIYDISSKGVFYFIKHELNKITN